MHNRAHYTTPELCIELLITQILVEKSEFLNSNVFVIKDLNYLLSRRSLFYISVYSAYCRLL